MTRIDDTASPICFQERDQKRCAFLSTSTNAVILKLCSCRILLAHYTVPVFSLTNGSTSTTSTTDTVFIKSYIITQLPGSTLRRLLRSSSFFPRHDDNYLALHTPITCEGRVPQTPITCEGRVPQTPILLMRTQFDSKFSITIRFSFKVLQPLERPLDSLVSTRYITDMIIYQTHIVQNELKAQLFDTDIA